MRVKWKSMLISNKRENENEREKVFFPNMPLAAVDFVVLSNTHTFLVEKGRNVFTRS